LGLPPTATYAALSLWNYACSPGTDLPVIENILILHTFTGTLDEEWFYKISIAVEARGARIIPVMLEAMDAVRSNESKVVTSCLLELATCIQEVGMILERMHENCSPDIFYHLIRPFFSGSKNMGAAGLPRGVFYDEGDGKGEWRHLNGGSNAQSSLIQFFDIVLGVQHSATGNSKVAPDGNTKHGFLQVRKRPTTPDDCNL
jgi:indoleamine 2,3-dioxygenase